MLSRSSGEPLPGAQVTVVATGQGAMAGVAGRFQLGDVPPGTHEIRVDMIGYHTRTVTDVDVAEGETARLDVVLERATIEVADIRVTAQQERGSVVSLLGDQRNASGVVSVISAERISRSPDGDAAAAIKRVSGVSVQEGKYVFVRGLGGRYTTSSLNGSRIPSPEPERRVVPLDLFPSSLLQSISTRKTFTPDQPGDFAGAAVDIRTPDFPVRRATSLSISSGFRPGITGRPVLAGHSVGSEWLAMAAGSRELPAAARDYSGNASRGQEVNRVVNSFRNAWTVREEIGSVPASARLSTGGSAELAGWTLGYLGSVTYSSSTSARFDAMRARVGTGHTEIDRYDGESGTSSVLWGGLLNVAALFGDYSQVRFSNSYSRSADHEAKLEDGVDENTRSHVEIHRLTYVERAVRSQQLSAEHQLGVAHRIDWSLNSSAVSREEPDRSEFVKWLDPEVPIWFKDFEGAVRTWGGLDEGSLEASLEYGYTFGSAARDPHRISLGGRWRITDRAAFSQGFRMQPFHWSPTDERWQADPEEFFDGRYSSNGEDNFLLARELAGGSYDAQDELRAAFLMGELQAGDRLRLMGGARLERYELLVRSENQLGQASEIERSYTDLLPAVSATLAVGGDHQLRASASRTLARPEYRELAPITYREVLGGDQVIGNADLDHTRIANLDVRWEWYPSPGEVISVGVFAKRFDRPIEQRYLARSGTDTRTFENAEDATSRGVELDLTTGLGRIARALEPFSLFTNVTLIRSRVDTGPDEATRAMVGQAPWVVNTGLTYAHHGDGLSATLLYNAVGERIMNARASGSTVEDVVERPRHLVDVSARVPLLAGATGKLDVQNVLDAPYELVQGPVMRERYRTGRRVSFGVSWQW